MCDLITLLTSIDFHGVREVAFFLAVHGYNVTASGLITLPGGVGLQVILPC